MAMSKNCFLFCCIFLIFSVSAFAKSLPPPEVKPLSTESCIFKTAFATSADSNYFFGLIVVESAGDNEQTFSIPVYSIKINKFLELDVQCVFIKSMEFKNEETITVVNEKDNVYEVNINTHEVLCVSNANEIDARKIYEKVMNK